MVECIAYIGRVVAESQMAVLFQRESDRRLQWFPKSQVITADTEIQIPHWMVDEECWISHEDNRWERIGVCSAATPVQ